MNGFDAEKYKQDINRLGLEAVNARGTPDFQLILCKLKTTFISNYILYLYDVFALKISFDTDESQASPEAIKKSEEKQEKIDLCSDFAEKNYEKIIEGKVNNFNPENVGESELPFFSYLIFDFKKGGEKSIAKERMKAGYGGYSAIITDREAILLKKMRNLYESLDKRAGFISEAAEILDEKEEKLAALWGDYAGKTFFSLDDELEDGTYEEIISDERENVEAEVTESTDVHTMLLVLNRIYHDSFMEKHRTAFPPYFTNELIKEWIKALNKKSNVSFNDYVRTNWDYINFSDRRTVYREAEYYCIREFIYDWFEEVRREIFGKEIAERIGMSASNFTKVCKQAEELIRQYAGKNNGLLQ